MRSIVRRMQVVGMCFILWTVAAEAATRLVVFEGFYRPT